MDSNKQSKQKISRKKFLQLAGSFIAGSTILGTTGYLIGNRNLRLNNTPENGHIPDNIKSNKKVQSPYKLIASFSTTEQIEAFDLYDDKIIVAAQNSIRIHKSSGSLLSSFQLNNKLRDIVVENDLIYILNPSSIEVYTLSGKLVKKWEACSTESDYCSMAVSPDFVFVTDVLHKNICQYTKEGKLIRFIESPDRFIIPSYTFGITYANESIYCSNPGRHRVERYSTQGDFLGTFGDPGDTPGRFCGCCNPVYLSYTSNGEIITSEKGNPRVSCYNSKGEFRSILLEKSMLGGGNKAYDVKINNDKIVVAGNNIVSTFQYDKLLASQSACGTCSINCPLREGITI